MTEPRRRNARFDPLTASRVLVVVGLGLYAGTLARYSQEVGRSPLRSSVVLPQALDPAPDDVRVVTPGQARGPAVATTRGS
ncbi:hypothetical protein DAERI_020108 [Deinococcus aerius]|uniref:Uncharacterized protein n=3 Tax=Deinococcus TaxID=1298 RepID=A0A2I9DIF7_9DEIO|nr:MULTISPECIES: hypothetical protein [Deinococcus]ABW35044.1 hypothetical protein Dgeo_3003 [Deinococcus geothermalis DSM 11300]MBB5293609.1 hypothetical protein [Deinococcus metallilatus]QBY07407.1 hypothetical protein E5F05_05400 [Deinococcus metallilatus]RXJ14880.1 hypothetical protein ERJ73_04120 [Deinococcus metallilatus]TLK31001.1 hypothetical protein FCS05_04435 [Deinococcus metallilatus]